MRSLKTPLMSVIYIFGVYHKHIIWFIGHVAWWKLCNKDFPLHNFSYFYLFIYFLPVWWIQREMHFSTARRVRIRTSFRTRLFPFPCSCILKTPLINKDALSKCLRKKHEMFSFICQCFSVFYQYSALVFASLDILFCWVLYFCQ